MTKEYKTFEEFYPFYLSQHSNRTNRRLHIIGTSLGILLFGLFIISPSILTFLLPFICGYGFAWVGHFFIEKNTPATFTYPLYSFRSDFRLLTEIYTGKRPF
eukprot:TRINITY_DN4161_c0_g1_i2.p2 TRINITY_DN4161_c0_g1~~TRINITY_DN4161_c0_g1_i2.p2  ORF type:complete len:111 (-),score=28.30 TRINITY_DN4161_c0_g1_i2:99-404(-)